MHQRVSEQVLLNYCKLAAADCFMLDGIRESVSKVGSVCDAYFLSSYLFVVDGRPHTLILNSEAAFSKFLWLSSFLPAGAEIVP